MNPTLALFTALLLAPLATANVADAETLMPDGKAKP
jgi:hypothetical protein